ncbi:MAG: hypothetical protein ABI720_05280 [Actinomycetes bacterium]
MKSILQHRPSPAMVVAVIALVVAMGGTAVAGSLINGADIKKNTVTGKQVKEPSLGAVPKAKNLTPIKSGQSMSGTFGAGGANSTGAGGFLGTSITYARPLATPIPNEQVKDIRKDTNTNKCKGPGKAAPGFLCLYNEQYNNVDHGYAYSDERYLQVNGKSVGVILFWDVLGDAPYVGGTWTVTAP